jgi:hypothetical protein
VAKKEAAGKEAAGKEAAKKGAVEKEAAEKEDNDEEEDQSWWPLERSDDDGPICFKCPIFFNICISIRTIYSSTSNT